MPALGMEAVRYRPTGALACAASASCLSPLSTRFSARLMCPFNSASATFISSRTLPLFAERCAWMADFIKAASAFAPSTLPFSDWATPARPVIPGEQPRLRGLFKLLGQDVVPFPELNHRAHQREPPLRDSGASVFQRFHLARILFHREQFSRDVNGFVVVAAERVRRRQEVNVVGMMADCHRANRHSCIRAHWRQPNRTTSNGIVPAAGLRPDVAGHVERVGNVRHQFGITLATRPCVFGEVRSLKAVNHIMMHSGDDRAPPSAIREGSPPLPCDVGFRGFFSGSVKPLMIISAR